MSDLTNDKNYIQELRERLAEAQEEIRQLRANPIPDLYKAQYALILDERDTYRQELAEAQAKIARQEEELRIVAAQRQDKQAQITEARALLMHFAKFDPTWVIDGNPCLFCNARVEDKNVIHKPDCFWVDTHLFLTNQSR